MDNLLGFDSTEVFSAKAEDYTRARPGYPIALYRELEQRCGITAKTQVADIGAGTGLFAIPLLDLGCQVSLVEPNAKMRSVAEAELQKRTNCRVLDGSSEKTNLETESIDLITAAQAFHWFEPGQTKSEFKRALRQHSWIALVWNNRDGEHPIQDEMAALFRAYGGALLDLVRSNSNNKDISGFFSGGTLTEIEFPSQQMLDLPGLISLILSRSYMPSRESDAGREVIDRAAMLFEKYQTLGRVTIPYKTSLHFGQFA